MYSWPGIIVAGSGVSTLQPNPYETLILKSIINFSEFDLASEYESKGIQAMSNINVTKIAVMPLLSVDTNYLNGV